MPARKRSLKSKGRINLPTLEIALAPSLQLRGAFYVLPFFRRKPPVGGRLRKSKLREMRRRVAPTRAAYIALERVLRFDPIPTIGYTNFKSFGPCVSDARNRRVLVIDFVEAFKLRES